MSVLRSMSCRLVLTGLVLCAPVVFSVGAETANEAQSRLLESVKYLSSEELEGRAVGTKGLQLAAEYVKAQFADAGLDVTQVDGDAFHTFSVTTGTKLGEPNSLTFLGPDEAKHELKIDGEFRPCSFGAAGDLTAPIVFCGYGIDNSGKNYNDFADIDLKGKVALIMRRVPRQSVPDSPFSGPNGGVSRDAALRTKVSHAFERGAVAVIFVNDPFSTRKNIKDMANRVQNAKTAVIKASEVFVDQGDDASAEDVQKAKEALTRTVQRLRAVTARSKEADPDPLMAFGYGGGPTSDHGPIFHISQVVCDRLLQAALGQTLEQLESKIDESLEPQSVELANWTGACVSSVQLEQAEVHNIIGVIEGEGPLADETIVIGAHVDHVGRGGAGSRSPGSMEIHNGADDNASGTAALIELARRFAASETKPTRRLVFIGFTAEEIGLVGSARYVREPVFPLENTIAMFNMDMVGRLKNERLTVFGSGTSPRWVPLLAEANEQGKFELVLKPEGFGPSDHSSFYRKKIPVLHFFTGTHEDYHRPGDDWDKINVGGMDRIVNMIETGIRATLAETERPKYLEVKGNAQTRQSPNRPYFGSVPNFRLEEPGYVIQATIAGSPARKAGIAVGDRLIRIGEDEIKELKDFDPALGKFKAGDTIDVVVIRGEEEVKLKVALDPPR